MAPTRIQMQRILCPTDFSPFSTRALERALPLARWFDARVTALHVVPYALPAGPGLPYFPLPIEATPQLEEAARALDRFVEPFLGEEVPIETCVSAGDPAREIEATAEALGADLVVMGTHGRSGLTHLLLGSVTDKVLHRAGCPVLTVGNGATPPAAGPLFHRILCAADLKNGSGPTVDFALSLAEEGEAELTLLHVLESGSDPASYAAERLRSIVPAATRDFCQVTARVTSGTPWRGILSAAEETRAELIVMGAHSNRPIGRTLFGSTVSHVVRHAVCPVLVARETEGRRLWRTDREAEVAPEPGADDTETSSA